jgi:hypothetical protein
MQIWLHTVSWGVTIFFTLPAGGVGGVYIYTLLLVLHSFALVWTRRVAAVQRSGFIRELHERASTMPRLMNSNLHVHIVFAYHCVDFRIYAEEVRALAAGLPD